MLRDFSFFPCFFVFLEWECDVGDDEGWTNDVVVGAKEGDGMRMRMEEEDDGDVDEKTAPSTAIIQFTDRSTDATRSDDVVRVNTFVRCRRVSVDCFPPSWHLAMHALSFDTAVIFAAVLSILAFVISFVRSNFLVSMENLELIWLGHRLRSNLINDRLDAQILLLVYY